MVAVRPTGETWTATSDAAVLRALTVRVQALAPTRVVLEATGGYELAAGQPKKLALITRRQELLTFLNAAVRTGVAWNLARALAGNRHARPLLTPGLARERVQSRGGCALSSSRSPRHAIGAAVPSLAESSILEMDVHETSITIVVLPLTS